MQFFHYVKNSSSFMLKYCNHFLIVVSCKVFLLYLFLDIFPVSKLQFGRGRGRRSKSVTFLCTDQRQAQNQPTGKWRVHRQNVDLPPIQPKKKKKPYPIPLKQITQAARADKKLAQMGVEKPLLPPKNGLLVPKLVPVAHDVLDAWKILIQGVSQLLHVIPVHACRLCFTLCLLCCLSV